MNIKEAEEITGITKQNIRFYEKQGLIFPKRNSENDYREYGTEDIRRLKMVKVLRKLGMPIEDISQVLEGKIQLGEAMKRQREKLEQEKQNLDAAIHLCHELEPESVQTLDIDQYLVRIEEEEAKGSVFLEILSDFRQVARGESRKTFSFMPDTMIQTPKEFTEELFKYARENQADITITKESMYPEFVMDGVEYIADREIGRMGAVVRCDMMYPELAEPSGIPERRRSVLKFLVHALPIIILFLLMASCSYYSLEKENLAVVILSAMAETSLLVAFIYPYWKTKG